jgi:hypothetical protein
MPPLRIRISTVLKSIAIVAALLAYYRWRQDAPGRFGEVIPFELLAVVAAIILGTFALMLRGLCQR